MKNKLLGALFTVLLFSCGSPYNEVHKHLDNTGKELKVVVTTYPSQKELNANVRIPAEGLVGQAHLSGNDCDIKLYEPRTIRIDDEYTLTLGHELMHCLYGNYHK